MRQISAAHTADQILDESKDITRRYGWENAKVGERLQVIRKGQGLKKGEHVERLKVIRVVSARRESLSRLVDEPDYGREEMRREGFPGLDPREFIDRFFLGDADEVITRIEFEYPAGRPDDSTSGAASRQAPVPSTAGADNEPRGAGALPAPGQSRS